MRRTCLLIVAILVFGQSNGQETLARITKAYFRSDPFNGEFSTFITHLLNDPNLTNKIIEKRTDTSLFYFQGVYKTFDPFFFKPARVQVILTEIVVTLDSTDQDTVFSYQIFAYWNDTKEGTQDVKKEFDKILRKYRGSFPTNQYSENPLGNLPGATYNFFDPFHVVAPFALSWFGPTHNKEMCLVLTVRMDNWYNKAVLPVPFYAPK